MIKKSEKSINIENIDNKGGTINFYTTDDDSGSKNKKTVSVAAVDKYSSPLECEVMLTKWGDLHKVSAAITNPLIGQRVYQKYLVYKDEEKARETLNFIASVFDEIKDDAETNRKHSAFLIPKAWKLLSNISDDADLGYRDMEDASIRLRFNNNQFDSPGDPIPRGWVGEEPRSTYTQGVSSNIAQLVGAPSQYTNPGRTNVLSSKDSSSSIIKTSSKISRNPLFISSSFSNIFNKISSSSSSSSKKTFSKEEATTIAEQIGLNFDIVDFSINDFINGLNIEIEHDNDPQTDVVRDDEKKWQTIGKIAWRHLKESPEYYVEILKMEKKFNDNKKH